MLLKDYWKVMYLQFGEQISSSEFILGFHTICEIDLFEELWRLKLLEKWVLGDFFIL